MIKSIIKWMFIGFVALTALGMCVSYNAGSGVQQRFLENKISIKQGITDKIEAEKFSLALDDIEMYKAYDEELQALYPQIKEKVLIAELKAIPVANTSGNLSRYEELASLFPDNVTYKEKLAFYRQQTEREKILSKVEGEKRIAEKKAATPNPLGWRYFSSKDKMTGEESHFISSASTGSMKPMDFPYTDVTSWIGIGCKAGELWSYFGFSEAPNLTGDKTEDGYSTSESRLRVGETLGSVRLSQTWGDRFLNVFNDTAFINSLSGVDDVMLELSWHGNGKVHYKYLMIDFEKRLVELKEKCSA
uniref:hypothetical protein n=1 Tax=Ningiella ruwaisensis TaxID=2364274 RepID=UPI00109F1873|nr:hypothetical protein [Ningiella ruwaisensis]